jgi:quinol monooxygenase YgiN
MSKIIYCIAQFTPKDGKFDELFNELKSLEPDTLREDGCISYRVTKHIKNEYAQGDSMPIVFNEQWASKEDFENHCNKPYIIEFFQKHCINKDGLVKEYNVSVYTDE